LREREGASLKLLGAGDHQRMLEIKERRLWQSNHALDGINDDLKKKGGNEEETVMIYCWVQEETDK